MNEGFSINILMGLSGIVLIPVLFWFFRQRHTSQTLFIGSFFIFVFSKGTIEILGLQDTYLRLLTEVLVLIIFIKGTMLFNKQRKHFPGIFWLILFIIVSILSGVLNQLSPPQIVLFFRDYLLVFVFFYGVVNLKFSHQEVNILSTLLVYLFISQVFANLFKPLIFQNIVEPYVGTMAVLGGSLTVLFALFGTSYAISNYLVSKDKKFLLWTIGFLVFSLLGGKRSTIVYFPIIFIILSFVYYRRFEGINFKIINRLTLFGIISLVMFYFAVRLMPSLNEERQVWGSFDLEYALDYSERYVTTGAGAVEKVGRAEAPAFILANMVNDNPYNLVLGYGAGHLVKSSFNDLIVQEGSQQDLTEKLYGVGYGARTGMLQFILQIGLIGLITYLFLLRSIYRYSRINLFALIGGVQLKIHYLFLIAIWFVFLLDFFTYSVTIIKISALSLTFFFYLGIIGNQNLQKEQ